MNPTKTSQAAFTLLELLVVLAILGAMLSLVAPNISVDSDEESLKREAQTLRFALQKVADNAWLSGSTSVISINGDEWRQWLPIENASGGVASSTSPSSSDSETKQDDVKVTWVQEEPFYESNANVQYDIDVELKALKKALSSLSFTKGAQFVFLANGEYLPFSISLQKSEYSLTIEGDGINAIKVY
ncbi:type II secretion system protein [Marinomonas mediterranea]|jgi:prepilin-type N-terminal cleavage/methylation domain|uniref:General secretion pathway protein H n=1 Tax=Marinomonas mediterranea (strain ATCC 700492 / JCM 21426 / NBRC 103028 / MMB-1) TaxID=717774 RepID=F2K4G6_MARM1|nr:type II secretion system protein [Marinomonas mediterranea]ADZ90265.1 hypothetical protein Marme_0990 [Marinomonas mediterranea MMB-1]WCN16456.1 type II secretion system protein GspH [Marinomonas mediterranea MMB-1]